MFFVFPVFHMELRLLLNKILIYDQVIEVLKGFNIHLFILYAGFQYFIIDV